jgi:D-beta-D-heptose 7-phosphate kinase/D-beta-D-heptose 1-phosphate adenosyltransferase
VVGKPGTATVSARELLQRLAQSGLLIEGGAELSLALAPYRRAGKRIVFTNGVFDGLSSGHIAFLRAAKQLGDVLVVGVNSDRGVLARRDYPPQLPEDERLAVLAALELVDHVVAFDEPTPEAIIRLIRPDVHVKGGDYRVEELPEAAVVYELGGEVVLLPLFDGSAQPQMGGKLLRRS